MGYAFISYSSKNRDMINSINRVLSDNHIHSWIAPDSIPAGENYASCINRAIKDCSCFVLLLTDDSQNSIWVGKELERAIHYQKPIISIETKEIKLNDAFEFFLSSVQFVKVKNFDSNDKELKKALSSILSFTYDNPTKSTNETISVRFSHETKSQSELNSISSKLQSLNPDEEYYNLGRDYLLGNDKLGIKQDFKQAFSYFLKAADKYSHPSAQYCLGFCYDYGIGVDINTKKAKDWYELSASQKNTAALFKLGVFYEYNKQNPDIDKAIKYYLLAADKDFPPAQHALGLCYYKGKGFFVDKNKAKEYFILASNQNYADAQYELGCFFYFKEEYSEAKHWFTLAANQNHSSSIAFLGSLYYVGDGVEQNYTEANRLSRLSASYGNIHGCILLYNSYRFGYGVEKNEALSNKWRYHFKSSEALEAQRKEILDKEFDIIRQLPIKNEST